VFGPFMPRTCNRQTKILSFVYNSHVNSGLLHLFFMGSGWYLYKDKILGHRRQSKYTSEYGATGSP